MIPDFADAHDFVELSAGLTHYLRSGPRDGQAIVLIHGATVPMWEFDRIAPYLHKAGFETVRFDLYGHGYSARPKTEYNLALFASQLAELIDTLDLDRFSILGHSLGSAIASETALRYSRRIERLLLAAPLVDFTANVRGTQLLNIPLLGEVMTHGLVVPMLRRRRARRYANIECGAFSTKFNNQLAYSGFPRALLSMFRSGTLADSRGIYAKLPANIPTALLRGTHDEIMTSGQMRELRDIVPHATEVPIPGTGHPFMLTHPDQAATAILNALT